MHKLVNVLRVSELEPDEAVERELALITVAATPAGRAELIALAQALNATVADLGIIDVDDVLVLSIVTVGNTPESCTANLLGPVVVNLRTMVATQAVVRGDHWSAREPLA